MQLNWQKVVVEKPATAINPAFAIVFGSYAHGSARKNRVLGISLFQVTERFLLAGEIVQSCNVDVDLIDKKTVDTSERYGR
ncbi:hypothetical protein ACIQ7N_15555 [Lysinibacillus sp. NPDC095746]|uniref:hypothetical protein n=1 Tax=Lysinibacillus sp. NPDC095746 TaxID=3364134 RepID=UPI0037F3F0A3